MRIVNTDNLNRENTNEHFELFHMSQDAAEEIAEVLNKHFSGNSAQRYWKVVEDDYELSRVMDEDTDTIPSC
jgi:hypothetical protein